MKERIWINRVTNEIVFQTVAFPCTMSVSLQFERSPFGTLNSTTEMSQMECCHPGNFQVTWSQIFQEPVKVAQELEHTVQLFGRVSTHRPLRTSTTMRCGWLVQRGLAARSTRAALFV